MKPASFHAPFTYFGKTYQNIPVEVYLNSVPIRSTTWDEEWLICRNEDLYGLMASDVKNKKIRIIYQGWIVSGGYGG